MPGCCWSRLRQRWPRAWRYCSDCCLSILVNPLFFAALDRILPWLETPAGSVCPRDTQGYRSADHDTAGPPGSRRLRSGREPVGQELEREKLPFLVIEDRHELVEKLRASGIEAIHGNGAAPEVIAAANLGGARLLLVAIPDAFEAGQIVEQGRAANPAIEIIARAHSDEEVQYLERCGADLIIMGELEIARRMAERALGPQATTREPDREPVRP